MPFAIALDHLQLRADEGLDPAFQVQDLHSVTLLERVSLRGNMKIAFKTPGPWSEAMYLMAPANSI